jgi:hypothetical protein
MSSKKVDKGKKEKEERWSGKKRTYRRHGLSDELWNKMERLLPDFDDTL